MYGEWIFVIEFEGVLLCGFEEGKVDIIGDLS